MASALHLSIGVLCQLISSSIYAASVLPWSTGANEISRLHQQGSSGAGAALYPRSSETRDVKTLDGIWNFRPSPVDPEYGFRHTWYEQDLAKVWRLSRAMVASEAIACKKLPPADVAELLCCSQLLLLHALEAWVFQIVVTLRAWSLLSPMLPDVGYVERWFDTDLSQTGEVIPMPVPSSYNDVTEETSLRDHVGLVWYDTRFHVPAWWVRAEMRIWLRFSSVHYAAQVWVNGKSVMHHEMGHLPFEAEITEAVRTDAGNLLTVACDNTLLSDTVPQGQVANVQQGNQLHLEQSYTFDFFNYAGIHRSVFLYTTPMIFIDDIIVNTDIQGLTGFIASVCNCTDLYRTFRMLFNLGFVIYNVTYKGYDTPESDIACMVQLFDKNDSLVVTVGTCAGLLEVANAHFWWPYLMHPEPGYLYTLQASIIGPHGAIIDTYRQKIGIRTVTWSNTTVYINDKPVYMRGFGMHEDSDIRGKGWDAALWVKNFNLIKWVGANAFRTSHYPYAEEIYQLADELGIMIVDECPSVDTDYFSDALLAKHKDSLTELIRRDKNHPSVIMWSIANEPRTQYKAADAYFGEVARHVRSMDLSRPITIALARSYSEDKAGRHLDVISFNRYNAWYHKPGSLQIITPNVVQEAAAWHHKYNKPILMSEYGADTIAGLHLVPEYVWSEEYQVELMSQHFKAFDILRQRAFFVGEFIWNFADFKTAQTVTRVGGNKKGIFTRSRQPKASAHHLRKRYHQLAQTDDAAALPANLYSYLSDSTPIHHQEL